VNSSQLSRSTIKVLLLALALAVGFGLAVEMGWIDVSQAQVKPIQDQGSSPYCLFAVNAYLINGDMWRIEADYHRRNLPSPPTNSTIFPLLSKKMGVAKHWDSGAVQAQVQRQPVAVTGHGHAVVLLSWRNGQITYLDSLHAGRSLTMTDRAFWAWWDGWGWWTK
jgi:hypothetical protein